MKPCHLPGLPLFALFVSCSGDPESGVGGGTGFRGQIDQTFDVPGDDPLEVCLGRPVAVLDDGRAACVVTITVAGEDPCPVERGWVDPADRDGVRRSRVVGEDGGSARICEIQQLLGDARDACRTTPACDGCGSGWCKTEIAAFAPACEAEGTPLRFVGDALAGATGRVEEICYVAP